MHGKAFAIRALVAWAALATATHAEPQWRFDEPERIVAVADVHGAYAAFERILARAGIVDASGRWAAGGTHLVVLGDVLDRGPDSRRALDLIMRLESEAPAAGGRVHFVLGNHEVMNLTGDLRYVAAAEFAAFAADERREQRDAAFEQYLEARPVPADPQAARRSFDRDFPAGYFAHRDAFAPDGVYGAWLLEKPVLLVIGDVAFAHGGLAASVTDGAGLNGLLNRQLGDYVAALDALEEAGVLAPTDGLADHAARVAAHAERVRAGAWSEDVAAAAETILALQSAELFSPDSPYWYRGNVGCSRLSEQDRLAAALERIGAERLVVGHTPTPEALVLSRLDERLVRIDTGMLTSYYGGRAAALIIEAGALGVLYEDEPGLSRPIPQPRRVGSRPAGLSAEALEAALATGEVEARPAADTAASLVRIVDGDLALDALFTRAERDALRPAVAAYRLDRLLGLEMVPVTVAREIGGEAGALQYLPPGTLGEAERAEQGLGGSAWCPLADQVRSLYLFDALIFNEARTLDRIRYDPEGFALLLLGHERSFTTDRGRPPYLADAALEPTPAWRAALAVLDEAGLGEALGDVVDRRRIRALLERRDGLLEIDP